MNDYFILQWRSRLVGCDGGLVVSTAPDHQRSVRTQSRTSSLAAEVEQGINDSGDDAGPYRARGKFNKSVPVCLPYFFVPVRFDQVMLPVFGNTNPGNLRAFVVKYS